MLEQAKHQNGQVCGTPGAGMGTRLCLGAVETQRLKHRSQLPNKVDYMKKNKHFIVLYV